jgi:hypothetical protein
MKMDDWESNLIHDIRVDLSSMYYHEIWDDKDPRSHRVKHLIIEIYEILNNYNDNTVNTSVLWKRK